MEETEQELETKLRQLDAGDAGQAMATFLRAPTPSTDTASRLDNDAAVGANAAQVMDESWWQGVVKQRLRGKTT
eukprot:9171333-Prorocentrum_lima.AAC.1